MSTTPVRPQECVHEETLSHFCILRGIDTTRNLTQIPIAEGGLPVPAWWDGCLGTPGPCQPSKQT